MYKFCLHVTKEFVNKVNNSIFELWKDLKNLRDSWYNKLVTSIPGFNKPLLQHPLIFQRS
eukprot:2461986-Ditylum_brightwellii.AAC.1